MRRAVTRRWRRLAAVALAALTPVASASLARPAPALAANTAPTEPAAAFFTLKQIAPGVYAAIDGKAGRAGSNAGFVIGDDGVLVIDSFFDPAATQALLGEVRRLTPLPIRYVVNTHYHIDHVAGDAVLKAAGATIIAHRNVRGWIRTENPHLFGGKLTPKTAAMIAALALPDLTTDTGLTVWLGTRRVVIRPVLGHTGGDLIVGIPDAKTLFCGDIVWRHVSPNLIDGDVAAWTRTVAALQQDPAAAQTVFVPGHGDVANRADLADFERYLVDLNRVVAAARASGLAGKSLVAAALPNFAKLHGDWDSFGYFAPLELGFMADELAGRKTRPPPVTD